MTNTTVKPPYLSTQEFGAALGVSTATVERWIKSGHVKAMRVGPRLIRIPVDQIELVCREITLDKAV